MTNARRLHHSYQDYLVLERESPVKHEYCDGEIYAMAGGTPEHAALAAKVIALLERGLAGCHVMTSDLKVRIESTDLTTYPDASVICGPLERSSQDANAVINPVLLVEVTSTSTEDYDRGEKLSHYRQIPTVRTILILSHREARITAVRRESDGWRTTEHRAGETVRLSSPAAVLEVDEVYRALDGL